MARLHRPVHRAPPSCGWPNNRVRAMIIVFANTIVFARSEAQDTRREDGSGHFILVLAAQPPREVELTSPKHRLPRLALELYAMRDNCLD